MSRDGERELELELELAKMREREREREATGTLAILGLAGAVWARERSKQRAQKRRRAPVIADPPAAYAAACAKLKRDHRRLSKTAIALEMGIDRGTLNRYIDQHGLPYPPH